MGPQVPTQIPWTKDSDKEDGDRGTVYSLYNLANKRASNYGRCGSSQSGSCATDVASKTAGTVTVADLNLVVADALNYGTSGPSAAAVNNIRDSINTINAQAAQRYIARVSLDANVPGNGFGGSTQRVTVASPAASEDSATGNGLIPTACGGGLYYLALAGKAGGEGGVNDAPDATSGEPAGILPGAAYTKYSGTILAVKPTDEDLESYNKAPSTFGTSGGPLVNAQCGTSANSTGTVGSNTLMVGSVINPVTVKDDASAPYQLKGTAVTDPVEAGEAGSIAVTATEVTAALRGQTEFVTTVDFYKKKTPIGCIGRDVRFSNIEVTIDGGKKMVYTFCYPSGYKGASNPDDSLATNTNLYDVNMKTAGSGATAGSYFATVFGTGTGGNEPDTTAAITVAQAKQMSRVWDPVMAAQLTQGGMCCDALYYGNEGVGRPTIAGVGPVSDYEPPLAGGDMAAESPVGTMCPMHGSGNGYSTSTVGNVNQVNPSETLLLEGQAFYVSLAPSQYSLPLTSTTAETQTANEAKQKQCATHITSMMKMNKKAIVASTGTAPTFADTSPFGTAGTPGKFGYSYSAIYFPLWKVGIGSTDPVNQYIVPNCYCYANACFNDFAEVGTNPLSRGLRSLVSSCRGPTWLWLRQVRRVAVPTRPVLLRLLPGTVLRLSWLHATAPTAPLKESWPLLVSFLWLKRLSACSQ